MLEDLREHLVNLPKKFTMSFKGHGACKSDERKSRNSVLLWAVRSAEVCWARDLAYQYVHHRGVQDQDGSADAGGRWLSPSCRECRTPLDKEAG